MIEGNGWPDHACPGSILDAQTPIRLAKYGFEGETAFNPNTATCLRQTLSVTCFDIIGGDQRAFHFRVHCLRDISTCTYDPSDT